MKMSNDAWVTTIYGLLRNEQEPRRREMLLDRVANFCPDGEAAKYAIAIAMSKASADLWKKGCSTVLFADPNYDLRLAQPHIGCSAERLERPRKDSDFTDFLSTPNLSGLMEFLGKGFAELEDVPHPTLVFALCLSRFVIVSSERFGLKATKKATKQPAISLEAALLMLWVVEHSEFERFRSYDWRNPRTAQLAVMMNKEMYEELLEIINNANLALSEMQRLGVAELTIEKAASYLAQTMPWWRQFWLGKELLGARAVDAGFQVLGVYDPLLRWRNWGDKNGVM